MRVKPLEMMLAMQILHTALVDILSLATVDDVTITLSTIKGSSKVFVVLLKGL